MADISPIPSDSPLVGMVRDPATGKIRTTPYMSEDFQAWLLELTTRQNNTPESVGNSVNVAASQVSIGATPAFTPDATGLYRVSIYARIVRAGTVSSELTVTISWTDKGVACSVSSALANGNTTSTVIVQPTILIRADAATAISYATTRASVGATEMQYDLRVVVEGVPT